jgi:hypothetical protein
MSGDSNIWLLFNKLRIHCSSSILNLTASLNSTDICKKKGCFRFENSPFKLKNDSLKI